MKPNKHLTVRGKLKDRGTIKWTAMMLPEHVQMLRDWQEETTAIPKPALESSDFDAISEEIQLAFQSGCLIQIKCWENGRILSYAGIIQQILPESKQFLLNDGHKLQSIGLHNVTGATTIG